MYSLRLFGGMTLESPSGPLSGPALQKRRLALLAMLAAARGTGWSRDKLMAYLWAEHDEASARHRLADSVYVLRKALGDEAVPASGEYLRLDADIVRTDTSAFAAALQQGDFETAVDFYAGPFMDGFYLSGAAEFEDWVESERSRLANQYEEALESLAEAAEEAEDHTRAAGWWRRLTAHDPYNSRFMLRLMRSLAAAGDPANAVQLAREHERLLREDLGVEPPAEVVDLAERLARQQAEVSEVVGEGWPEGELGGTELEGGRRPAVRRHPFLTWRTAAVSLSIAFALGSVVAAGWIVLGGTGYLLFRGAAAGFVEPEDCVVVAEFENQTERDAFGLAVRLLVVTDIGQTSYVEVVGHDQVRETLGLMRLPDTTLVDQGVAVEIARRQNCPAAVTGTVAPLGTGYLLSTQILEASTGGVVVPLSETAADETQVIGATERLARLVRRHLGESLPSIQRSQPLYRLTTSSLEALRLFTLAWERIDQRDYDGGVSLLEQAVVLDTAFAGAYRQLAAMYGRVDKHDAAYRSIELAYSHRQRLSKRERLLVAAGYHGMRGRRDSAVHYYRVAVEAYPDDGFARNNLGSNLVAMGRFEEALASFQASLEVNSRRTFARGNSIVVASALGQYALADSALAILREVTGRQELNHEADNALYRGDFAAVDSLARELVRDPDPRRAYRGWLKLAALAAMYGRMEDALALAQTAGVDRQSLRESLRFVGVAAFASGRPARALPYVDNLRAQSPFVDWALVEHERLGQVAWGYALAGDLRSARELLAAMDSVSQATGIRPPRGITEAVLAVIALSEGLAEDAVEHLRRAGAETSGYLAWDERFLLADALAALGQVDEAMAQYDTVTSTYRMRRVYIYVYCAVRPLAHERLGSLYLQVGDTVSAARHLAQFIGLWQDADPELQPRVEAARQLLAQLVPEET
jgi:DNA-binding SARP family transcriptional activator/Tfp pilus assembly protein PilF